MHIAYFWDPIQFASSSSSINASSYSSSETAMYLASSRQTKALPVSPSGIGIGSACNKFITVLFEAIGIASVSIRHASIASTCVTNFVS